MINPLFDIKGLSHELEANKQILVPNRRLARHITSAWGERCHQQGQRAWRQPQVQTLDTWLLECWQELQDRGYANGFAQSIINPHAERLIWEQVIDSDADKPPGIDGSAFAKLAQSALQNLERWRVPLSELAQSGHEASLQFLRWHRDFASLISDKHLLTPAQAQTFVCQAFQQGFLSKKHRVVLVAFNADLAPLYQDIIGAAFDECIYWRDSEQTVDKHLCIASNDSDEISQAALWAKQTVEASPEQNIGIVFPNLSSQRHRVERIFREVFTPEYCLPASLHQVPPFNISAGLPLSDTALISSALNLLNLQRSPQALDFYCQLLNDPFWGDAEHQQIIRAHCQLLLRKGYKLQPSGGDFRQCMKRAEDATTVADAPDSNATRAASQSLSQGLGQFEDRCRRLAQHSSQDRLESPRQTSRNSFAYWAEEFASRLTLLGWPGTRPLDSIEYQQQQLWFEVLETFAGLDAAIDPVDAHTALTQLMRICRSQIFQAEGSDSPVQILGLLEAAGLHFDSLWLAELHDSQWPQSPDYNPLLAVRLQRHHKMPRSSPEAELSIAKDLLTGFDRHCLQLIVSYGLNGGDNQRQRSRLLSDDIPRFEPNPDAGKHLLQTGIDRPPLQQITVDRAPPLTQTDAPIRGGSAVLRDQARCPFNAFAIWRLGAEALPEPAFGFTALERGILVHRALELFWADCKDSNTLQQMDSMARAALLKQSIASALKEAKKDRADLFGPRFSAIETQRLDKLLSAWLDVERDRSAFKVVAREEKINYQLGDLALSLRIDRIDQLNDGSIVLIDYKTGMSNIKGFADERPEEPQLLLYALATDQTLSALCFGQVSATRGVALKGLTSQASLAPGLSDLEAAGLEAKWSDTLDLWHQRLSALAIEFCQGDAEIAFYSTTALAYQSQLIPLNRWLEVGPSSELDPDPESESLITTPEFSNE